MFFPLLFVEEASKIKEGDKKIIEELPVVPKRKEVLLFEFIFWEKYFFLKKSFHLKEESLT